MRSYLPGMTSFPIAVRFGGSAHRLSPGLALAFCLVAPAAALAAGSSAWVENRYAATRLVDGGPAEDGKRLAGIEVRLAPHAITYWRDPGEAGVPPRFDFSASDNLGEARVLYPAPAAMEKGGVAAFGYQGSVLFPVEVTPKDASRPVTLGVTIDYAVCADICVPEKSEARLALDAPAPQDAAVREALRTVPLPRRLGQPGPLRIDAVERGPGGTLEVLAATPAGGATLFAELPEPWYANVSAGRPQPDGRLRFTLTLPDSRPAGPAPDAPMRLTLIGPEGAIDVTVPLDASMVKP